MSPSADAESARRRAAGFVAAHGRPLDRWRAVGLLGDTAPSGPIGTPGVSQRDDGACSVDAGVPGIDGTLQILAALDDVRALGDEAARGACDYLSAQQCEDGSWRREPGEAEADTLHVTGMLAGYLAKSRWSRPRVLRAAGDYLAARWSPDRVQGFAWPAIAAYAHFFANTPHDLSDAALQWCGRELERGFRTGHFDAARTARVLVLCDAGALPGARIEPHELIAQLVEGVGEDGGWGPAGQGASRARIEGSLDALAALTRLSPGG